MSSKNYLRLFQGGIIASLLIVFFVFSNLLFPFISSKQISFNILMEFLLPFYLILMLKVPEYRPRRSWIIYGLVAYFAVVFLTCFTGVDFNLSFWGNTERMLGFFHIFHFFLLYLYIISTFRDKESWTLLLSSSVVVATIESLAVLGKIAYGTIGNTAYVSGYLIFNLYFTAILFVRTKDKTLRWFWALPAVLMLFAFNRANTSGAIIGLGISILTAIFLIGLFSKKKSYRRNTWIVFGVLLVGVILMASQWNQPWFQNNNRLRALTASKGTFQTRLVSWEGAVKDFHNHPWLGVGFGNYANVFDRQFNSRFYNYSRSETYFDRAHNNVLEILSDTGVIGLIAYLSILFFAFRELWLVMKKEDKYVGWSRKGQTNIELILIFCLLIAYFIQNLAVFDSLVTYVGLMITLGLIAFHYAALTPQSEEIKKSRLSDGWEYGGLAIGLVFIYGIANYANFIPYRIFSDTISAYSQISQGQIWEGYQAYRQAFETPHPLARDCKATFVRLITGNPQALASLSNDQVGEILAYAIQVSQENIAENPKDSLKNLEFSQLAELVSRFQNNSTAQNKFHQMALQAMDQSIASSPGRATNYFMKGQIMADGDDFAGAEKTISYGISLNTSYPEGYCRLSSLYNFEKKQDLALQYFKQCAALDGLDYATVPSFLADAASSSTAVGDYPQAIKYANRLAVLAPSSYQIFANLAKLDERVGDYQGAIVAAQRVGELNPSLASDSRAYVSQLEMKLQGE